MVSFSSCSSLLFFGRRNRSSPAPRVDRRLAPPRAQCPSSLQPTPSARPGQAKSPAGRLPPLGHRCAARCSRAPPPHAPHLIPTAAPAPRPGPAPLRLHGCCRSPLAARSTRPLDQQHKAAAANHQHAGTTTPWPPANSTACSRGSRPQPPAPRPPRRLAPPPRANRHLPHPLTGHQSPRCSV